MMVTDAKLLITPDFIHRLLNSRLHYYILSYYMHSHCRTFNLPSLKFIYYYHLLPIIKGSFLIPLLAHFWVSRLCLPLLDGTFSPCLVDLWVSSKILTSDQLSPQTRHRRWISIHQLHYAFWEIPSSHSLPFIRKLISFLQFSNDFLHSIFLS